MTVQELLEELETIVENGGGEREIRIAYQPSWPLRATLGRVVEDLAAEMDLDGDEDELGGRNDMEDFVWISTNEGISYNESPYAPRAVFEG